MSFKIKRRRYPLFCSFSDKRNICNCFKIKSEGTNELSGLWEKRILCHIFRCDWNMITMYFQLFGMSSLKQSAVSFKKGYFAKSFLVNSTRYDCIRSFTLLGFDSRGEEERQLSLFRLLKINPNRHVCGELDRGDVRRCRRGFYDFGQVA